MRTVGKRKKRQKQFNKKFKEACERYEQYGRAYIRTEAMKIFCETDDQAVKLEALKLIAAHTI